MKPPCSPCVKGIMGRLVETGPPGRAALSAGETTTVFHINNRSRQVDTVTLVSFSVHYALFLMVRNPSGWKQHTEKVGFYCVRVLFFVSLEKNGNKWDFLIWDTVTRLDYFMIFFSKMSPKYRGCNYFTKCNNISELNTSIHIFCNYLYFRTSSRVLLSYLFSCPSLPG